MRARVTVRLKSGVLDPQGEAIRQALHTLGFASVGDVRVAKLVELDVEVKDAKGDAAEAKVREDVTAMAEKLLANPVIEDYVVEVTRK